MPCLLGDYAEGQAAYRQTSIAALAAAIGIYLLLQACFQSWLLGVSVLREPAGGARGRRAGDARGQAAPSPSARLPGCSRCSA